jgi:hypothetical protein
MMSDAFITLEGQDGNLPGPAEHRHIPGPSRGDGQRRQGR